MMLILISPYIRAMFLAKMVIPRSRSRSLESRMHSPCSCDSRNWPLDFSRQSTRVVLPWSTWAIIAMFRMSNRRMVVSARLFPDKSSSAKMAMVRKFSGRSQKLGGQTSHEGSRPKTNRTNWQTGRERCFVAGAKSQAGELTDTAGTPGMFHARRADRIA